MRIGKLDTTGAHLDPARIEVIAEIIHHRCFMGPCKWYVLIQVFVN